MRNAFGALIAEYRYNGLGHRISWHFDYNGDGSVTEPGGGLHDQWLHFAYDEQWRIVAQFYGSVSTPREQFIYHAAGMVEGGVSSSYIDQVVLRDRDANADGTLEERLYYCQNWHADVVAIVSSSGQQVQQVRYDEYGLPFGMWAGDVDGDGDVDSTDTTQIQTWISAPTYDVRGDLDLDGDVDNTDKTTATANIGTNLGWGVLSASTATARGGNRKGYAGYESDGKLDGSWAFHHVRNRVYSAKLGRWITRDPAGYIDSNNLYQYVVSNPIVYVDITGMQAVRPIRIPEQLPLRRTPERHRRSTPPHREPGGEPVPIVTPGGLRYPLDSRPWEWGIPYWHWHFPDDDPMPEPFTIRDPYTADKPAGPRAYHLRYGRCPHDIWEKLHKAVGKWCKGSGAMNCTKLKPGDESCKEIQRRALLARYCINARKNIRDICYDPSDPAYANHNDQIGIREKGWKRCADLYRDQKCGGGDIGDPDFVGPVIPFTNVSNTDGLQRLIRLSL